ncbi:MAG: PilZ domain-containing protein [Thermodesulfobacteriota bacterium]
MTTYDARHEQRLPVETAILPFLGSRDEDYQPFQYIIQDFSQNGVRIAIPSWVQSRERLFSNDQVNLHLPYKFKNQSRNQGKVAWEKWEENESAQVCGIALDKYFPETYPVFISLDTKEVIVDLAHFSSLEKLILLVLKDCVLLKKGILIYLEHLSSYFTRVSAFKREEYALFRQTVINDIKVGLEKNLAYLNEIYSEALNMEDEKGDILGLLDIDELRKSIESELYIELFTSVLSFEIVSRYLTALKVLEKKSYNNYNTLAMLYLQSL